MIEGDNSNCNEWFHVRLKKIFFLKEKGTVLLGQSLSSSSPEKKPTQNYSKSITIMEHYQLMQLKIIYYTFMMNKYLEPERKHSYLACGASPTYNEGALVN